ncbi:MAG: hypothetical protein MZW92_17745 [Comamonadaceae bacterium]|nr:hypothetical protein [Comamonadaceae bacterium]
MAPQRGIGSPRRQAGGGARHPEAAGRQHAGADARGWTRTLAEIQAALPAGMKIDEPHLSPGRLHRASSIDNLLAALRDGAILVDRHRLRLPALAARRR